MKMNLRNVLRVAAGAVLLCALSAATFAQNRASLRGLVQDEFGASIVGATVTLTDAKGVQKTATTGPDGAYAFNALTAGKYTVVAASAGFAPSEAAEVEVAAGRRDPFNISLKIAAIESEVKVNA